MKKLLSGLFVAAVLAGALALIIAVRSDRATTVSSLSPFDLNVEIEKAQEEFGNACPGLRVDDGLDSFFAQQRSRIGAERAILRPDLPALPTDRPSAKTAITQSQDPGCELPAPAAIALLTEFNSAYKVAAETAAGAQLVAEMDACTRDVGVDQSSIEAVLADALAVVGDDATAGDDLDALEKKVRELQAAGAGCSENLERVRTMALNEMIRARARG